MSATQFGRRKVMDHLTGVATYLPPTFYLALLKADPTDLGSFLSEISAAGYARKSLAGIMGAADGATGISVNTSVISFGPASADWGTSVFLGIADALTGGNMIVPGTFNAPRTIATGQPLPIPIGAVRWRQF